MQANTPDSVFQLLALLREMLLVLQRDYVLPALAWLWALLQRAWLSLQDSCKSVPGLTLHLPALMSALKSARPVSV